METKNRIFVLNFKIEFYFQNPTVAPIWDYAIFQDFEASLCKRKHFWIPAVFKIRYKNELSCFYEANWKIEGQLFHWMRYFKWSLFTTDLLLNSLPALVTLVLLSQVNTHFHDLKQQTEWNNVKEIIKSVSSQTCSSGCLHVAELLISTQLLMPHYLTCLQWCRLALHSHPPPFFLSPASTYLKAPKLWFTFVILVHF